MLDPTAETRRKTYKRLYRLFDRATPLPVDCGAVCGKACCAGDEKTGMLLFPGEETSLPVFESEAGRVAVCGRTCRRSERPLACRIFPFLPLPDENGRIRAVPDARAVPVCPLARLARDVRFSRRFLRRVKKAGRILMRDPECAAFLQKLGDEQNELRTLGTLLQDGKQTE